MSHRWKDRDRNRHDPYPPNRGGRGQRGGERSNYSHGGRGRGGRNGHGQNEYNHGTNNGRGWRDDGYNKRHRSSHEHTHTNRYPPQDRGRHGQSHGANQNTAGRNQAQQPEDMIVDKLPGEETYSEIHGNEENRPDSPQSTVDDSKPFAEKDYKEQLIAQIPDTEHDIEQFKRKLPVEALNPRTIAGNKPHSDMWKDRKDEIATKVAEEMKRLEDFQDDFGSDDDDDSYEMIHRASVIKEKEDTLSKFILALPTCHLLTIGFDYSGVKSEEKCFCPCNQVQTRKWRNLVCIAIGDGECKGRNSFKTPNALVAHLKSMPNCRFHKYTLRYLEELYRDWHVSKNLKHKGLYIENTPDYKKAVEEEKGRRDRRMLAEWRKLDKERQKIRAEREELKKTNNKQVENYRAELRSREAILTKLGVDITNIEDTLPPSASDMFPKHKELYDKFLSRVRLSYGLESKKPDDRSDDRTIQVKQNFCLQEVFEMWSNYRNECFGGVLFRELDDEGVKLLLSAWTIQYSAVDALRGAESDVKDDFRAVDAGGPEEQFAEDVWANLLSLKVVMPDGKELPLFEETEHGIQPVGDERFQSKFGKDKDALKRATNTAELYYRAIGRFAAHCLCRGRHLPNHIMPKLLWNAALRDCKPTDPHYSSPDLGLHVLGIGWTEATLENTKKAHESPNDFRKLIEEMYISSNTIWLDSFSQGLLVVRSVYCPDKGRGEDLESFPVRDTLFPFSLETVETLILATRQYSANDLLSKIVPVYNDDCEEIPRENQEKLFSNGLRDVLLEWEKTDPKKLPEFVQFCSGRSFLSTDPSSNFKIQVVFEIRTVEGNSSSADRLPESHTCDSQLSLPSEAYNGNVKVFKEKLEKALEYHKLFTMG